MKNISLIQEKKLLNILKYLKRHYPKSHKIHQINNYNDFKMLPITDYSDWKPFINDQKNDQGEFILCPELIRLQPTSGSTSEIKWIPYNNSFLKDLNQAASTWLYDLNLRYPGINSGKHYWSLSWLPEDLRDQVDLDDKNLMSSVSRILLAKIFAVPTEVMRAKTLNESLFATSCFLVKTHDLSLISVWSPTFLKSLLDFIMLHKFDLVQTLKTGQWPNKYHLDFLKAPKSKERSRALSEIKSHPDFIRLWPKLSLISCWNTAGSMFFAKELQEIFPTVTIQGKGLWATEAVITIAFEDEYLLAYQSYFYEFEDLESKKILRAEELSIGMQVSPIISATNGILRYKIPDRLEVIGFKEKCPKLLFKGREEVSDLVGEKISFSLIEDIVEKLSLRKDFVSIFAIKKPHIKEKPYYLALFTKTSRDEFLTAESLENELLKSFHYRLARELNQLGKLEVKQYQDPTAIYQRIQLTKGKILGNIKVETLLVLESDEFLYNE